jgi:hypothetical protein
MHSTNRSIGPPATFACNLTASNANASNSPGLLGARNFAYRKKCGVAAPAGTLNRLLALGI